MPSAPSCDNASATHTSSQQLSQRPDEQTAKQQSTDLAPHLHALPRFSQDLSAQRFVQNPYEAYDTLRTMGNIAYWDELSLPVVSSYSGVSMAFRDKRLGREAPLGFEPIIPEQLQPFYDIEAHSMLELDGDRHRRLRGLVLRAFTSRRIKELAPEIIAITDELLDALPTAEHDLLPSFATPLPIRIISRLLGVPMEMGDQLIAWSNAMVAVYTPTRTRETEDAAANASREFSDFMRSYIDKRRSTPADDLISHLIAAEEDGSKLSTDELITTCILLLNAGHEATVHSIGLGVKTLLEHSPSKTERHAMLEETHIDGTIEEILRFDPPLHMFQRWVREDTTFLGQDFKTGDRIGLLLGAANRDPETWDTPHVFDPTRKVKQNTAFGGGMHFCVGAPLARLELHIALPRLFARYPNLQLAKPPRYANTWHFHGLERLMVRTS